MDIFGLTAEYNPLHKGHFTQLQILRKKLGKSGGLIVMMSGPFCQRGLPAVLNKFQRAQTAILSGADLILELPCYYALQNARTFSRGAIESLLKTGLITEIFAGSEFNNSKLMLAVLNCLKNEPLEFKEILRKELANGKNYPLARSIALQKVLAHEFDPELISDFLKASNNILCLEYAKAIQDIQKSKSLKLPSHFKGFSIHNRLGSTYTENSMDTQASPFSASAIRLIIKNALQTPYPAVYLHNELIGKIPATTLQHLMIAAKNKKLLTQDSLMPFLKFQHLFTETKDFQNDYSEGIAKRFKEALIQNLDFDAAISYTASKNYTQTRVQRELLQGLLGAKTFKLRDKENQKAFENNTNIQPYVSPPYLRVLAFNKKGKYLLKQMRKTALVPVISRASDFYHEKEDPFFQALSNLDLKAQDFHSLLFGNKTGEDFFKEGSYFIN